MQENPQELPDQKTIRRFYARAKLAPNGCLVWTRGRTERGYGAFTWRGRKWFAHRLSWAIANLRYLPKGMDACHRCDNPPCIHPDHLFAGTRATNNRDMTAKGRSCGSFSDDQVREIRARRARGDAHAAISRDYGVSHQTIKNICNGKRYRHVK